MTGRPTPRKAWTEMVRGNARFVAGAPRHPRQDADHRAVVAAAQTPRAALFGCADSRLAAEIIFDKGLGDLFVVRNAGQVVSESVVGSLEYAVTALGVPLIVVLGHDACGAVGAAISSQAPDAAPLPPHIRGLIDRIVPAVRRVAGDGPIDPTSLDAERVGREHLRDTVRELLESSAIIAEAIAAGRLAIVGATYRLSEGTVLPVVVVGPATDADT